MYKRLLKTRLKHNPEYYRIRDLSKLDNHNQIEEEKEDEQYGFNAIAADENRPRGSTQPKLTLPLSETGFPDDLLQKVDISVVNDDNDSESDKDEWWIFLLR